MAHYKAISGVVVAGKPVKPGATFAAPESPVTRALVARGAITPTTKAKPKGRAKGKAKR